MKHIFIAAIWLLTTITTFAQPISDLKHIRERFASAAGYRVDFSATLDGEFYDMSGSITIDQKGRYFMDISTMTVMYDGDSQYVYMPSRDEVTIERPKNTQSFMTNPSLLFAFDDSDFAVSDATKSYGNKSYKTLILTPADIKKAGAKEVNIYLDSNKMPAVIEATLPSGQRFALILNKTVLPYPISKDMFTFSKDKYDGAEVIDLR